MRGLGVGVSRNLMFSRWRARIIIISLGQRVAFEQFSSAFNGVEIVKSASIMVTKRKPFLWQYLALPGLTSSKETFLRYLKLLVIKTQLFNFYNILALEIAW